MGLGRLQPRPVRMVPHLAAALAILALGLASASPIPEPTPAPATAASEAGARARAALGKEGFPWYDAPLDRVRVLRFRPDPEPTQPSTATGGGRGGGASWRWNFGDIVVFVLSATALGALVAVAAWTWRRFEPTPEAPVRAPRPGRSGSAEPLLPAALRITTDVDLWSEAVRRRAIGDLAGAVDCVFVHQILAVARLDLVRLAPDLTPRQIQRGVRDPEFRALMVPSLRQFEVSFYGHRDPSPAEFAAFWESAEAFQRLLADPKRAGGVAR